jgi:mevalonate kinase
MTEPLVRSACAKFILGGEHSVVHRGRALAFPLPSLRLEVSESAEPGLRVNGQNYPEETWAKLRELRSVLGGSSADGPGLSIRSSVPLASGLGSSAALCVAMARLVSARRGRELEGTELAELAVRGEALFHGKPSGVDPWTVALERPLVFRSADRSYRPLELDAFRASGLRFVLESSGRAHCTAEIVEAVNELREKTPLIWEDLMDALSTNAEAMARAFETEPGTLGRLMNDTHFRLQQLGVSDAGIDDAVTRMKDAGAIGAKLTGAGRGGFVLGLFREREAEAYAARRAPGSDGPYVWSS